MHHAFNFRDVLASSAAADRQVEDVLAVGAGTSCPAIGPDEALRHDPLWVARVLLQVERMTQSHHCDSVRDEAGIPSAIHGCLGIGACLGGGFAARASLAPDAFEAATGRKRERIAAAAPAFA